MRTLIDCTWLTRPCRSSKRVCLRRCTTLPSTTSIWVSVPLVAVVLAGPCLLSCTTTGLPLRTLIHDFRHQVLVLFKCLLLQPKVHLPVTIEGVKEPTLTGL